MYVDVFFLNFFVSFDCPILELLHRFLFQTFISRAQTIISITVTFMFQRFFSSLAKVLVLIFLFGFFYFYFVVCRDGQVHSTLGSLFSFFFFFLTITRSGRQVEIWWSVCISKWLRSLRPSFSMTDSVLCIYHLFAWSIFNFLRNSQRITFPIQSFLVLYPFVIIYCICLWYDRFFSITT